MVVGDEGSRGGLKKLIFIKRDNFSRLSDQRCFYRETGLLVCIENPRVLTIRMSNIVNVRQFELGLKR